MNHGRILIMAGGTGGHVIPALAVGRCLKSMGYEVLWLGTEKGLEATLVPPSGIPIHFINIKGLRRTGFINWLFAPFRLFLAFIQSCQAIRAFKPTAVLGMGGFVAGPGGVAAWVLRCPLIIHEQNAIAGVTNRYLRFLATEVFEAFPNSFFQNKMLQNKTETKNNTKTQNKIKTIGNPIREELLNFSPPKERFKERHGLRILIMGGSRGALAINQLCPVAFSLMKRPDIELWHQTGADHYDATKALYQSNKDKIMPIKIEPFINDIKTAYEWADIVICRSGAITVCELAAVGLGSILIPFPYAVDDHQTFNGRFLESLGGAILVQQKDLTPEHLKAILEPLMENREKILSMAENAYQAAERTALARVVESCTRF